MISDLWNAIWSAKVIIADCTGRNGNVFYEIGVAHTIGRAVILTAQTKNDIPFDLGHVRHIQYEYNPRGMKDFEQRLASTIEQELR